MKLLGWALVVGAVPALAVALSLSCGRASSPDGGAPRVRHVAILIPDPSVVVEDYCASFCAPKAKPGEHVAGCERASVEDTLSNEIQFTAPILVCALATGPGGAP